MIITVIGLHTYFALNNERQTGDKDLMNPAKCAFSQHSSTRESIIDFVERIFVNKVLSNRFL